MGTRPRDSKRPAYNTDKRSTMLIDTAGKVAGDSYHRVLSASMRDRGRATG